MKKKKMKWLSAAMAGVVIALLAGILVYAFFTDSGNERNTVFIANNTVEISEVYEPPVEQKPGENIFKKEVTVVNTGNVPCYVRVYADFSDSTVRARSLLSQDGNDFYSAVRNINDPACFVAHLTELAPEWEFVPDDAGNALAGFFYCKTPLQPGKTTAPLFTYVKTVNSDITEIRQFDITVYAESVQITDANGEQYSSCQNAWSDFLSKSE